MSYITDLKKKAKAIQDFKLAAMKIKLNHPYELSEEQYNKIRDHADMKSMVATRKDEAGKFWAKLWAPRYKEEFLLYVLQSRLNG
jgi:hypothetical protein